MRVCADCGELKSLDTDFVRIPQGGWYGRCRACRARRNRERYRSDPAYRAREIARVHRNQQLVRLRRKHTQRPGEREPYPEEIVSYVAALSGVTLDDLCGPSRRRRLIDARAAALYLLRTDAGLSSAEAG
jgi:hypothetical protein